MSNSDGKHVFVSYVREDSAQVDGLCAILEAARIPYWRDRRSLDPGDAWKAKIREAIRGGSLVFLACFSDNSRAKDRSHMNEELTLAIEEYRKMPPGRTWLIPVRLDTGHLPEWDLGAGRALSDLNYVDLFGPNQAAAAVSLVTTIHRAMGEEQLSRAAVLESVERATAADRTGPKPHLTTLDLVDVAALLDELAASDPIPDTSARTNGRLLLVAHPVGTSTDALARVSTTAATRDLDAAVRRAVDARGGPSFSPDLGSGVWSRRSSGMVNESGVSETGPIREDSLLLLKIAENGSFAVLCGRATSQARSQWRPLGSPNEPATYRVILPSLVLGLVHGSLRLAGDLASRYAAYNGPWVVGLRLTGLRGAIAYEYVQSGDEDVVQPYDADTYQRTATVDTKDLLERPAAITEQLVAALLRGIAVDRRYLPYSASEATTP